MATGTISKYSDGTDTGWTDITLNSDNMNTNEGTLKYRCIGNLVIVVGDSLKLKSAVTGTSAVVIGNIPQGVRPQINTAAVGGGRNYPLQCNTFANGNIAIYKPDYMQNIPTTLALYFFGAYFI